MLKIRRRPAGRSAQLGVLSWLLQLTTYLEALPLTTLASVTSNSSVSVGLLPAPEGLASLAPPTVLQLAGAGAMEGPVGLVSTGEGESITDLHPSVETPALGVFTPKAGAHS